jgi:hypothetical protein
VSVALQLEFENLGSQDQGYPLYRAPVRRGREPEWIWISPNQVPRVFVRPDDDEYETLKDRCSGTAVRYPELAETAALLEATDGALPFLSNLTTPPWNLTPLQVALLTQRGPT